MIYGGLVSVTFRKLSVHSIIELVSQSGLESIEWGGDVHVPHGDLEAAKLTRQETEQAGLTIAAYGSYYRVGLQEPVPYETVLDTALALGAPIVRVWAGRKNAEDADETYWGHVIADSQRIASLSAHVGLTVAYEYHPNTLTNTLAGALRLLQQVDHPAVKTYWQSPPQSTLADNLSAIDALCPWLSNIHVNNNQEPLMVKKESGEIPTWLQYLTKIKTTGRNHHALIEFVKNDSPEQYLEDAAILQSWLQSIN
jgi:3-dehydroshikimate dehydratase